MPATDVADPPPLDASQTAALQSGAPSSLEEHERELWDGVIKATDKDVYQTKTSVYSEEEGPESQFSLRSLLFK